MTIVGLEKGPPLRILFAKFFFILISSHTFGQHKLIVMTAHSWAFGCRGKKKSLLGKASDNIM